MRIARAAVISCLLSVGGGPAVAAAQRPTLVVLIAVDQMRGDYLERFGKQFTGGLARLSRGGAVFTNAYHDHAITETAPGHAVMLSGRFPRSTGIVLNTQGVNVAGYPMLGGGGPSAAPVRFRGSVLIDWMRAADPRSRALSVSRKDRGAILPMGRARQSVFWFASDGRFTTSTYYADSLPPWARAFNARQIPQSYAGKVWTLLLPPSAYPEPDSVPIESGGRNFMFPHFFPEDSETTAQAFIAYPAMDSLTAQFALAGVSAMRLGAGPQTDLLSVSFSTTDAVGHQFGPDSREIHDQLLRLDRYLGIFIDSLYRLRDSSRIVFALTGDHGMGSYPELWAAREHKEPIRVDVSPVFSELQAKLRAAGAPPGTISFEDFVEADRPALTAAGFKPDSVLTSLADALRRVPGVLRVDWVKDLAKADTVHDYVARRWFHMLPPDLPAELTVSIQPHAYYKQTSNATHGTVHDYDAWVPLVFYGPPFVTGKFAQPALVVDLAPTLAAALGVKPTERLDGRVRREALKP
jgi:hypothetical protein